MLFFFLEKYIINWYTNVIFWCCPTFYVCLSPPTVISALNTPMLILLLYMNIVFMIEDKHDTVFVVINYTNYLY